MASNLRDSPHGEKTIQAEDVLLVSDNANRSVLTEPPRQIKRLILRVAVYTIVICILLWPIVQWLLHCNGLQVKLPDEQQFQENAPIDEHIEQVPGSNHKEENFAFSTYSYKKRVARSIAVKYEHSTYTNADGTYTAISGAESTDSTGGVHISLTLVHPSMDQDNDPATATEIVTLTDEVIVYTGKSGIVTVTESAGSAGSTGSGHSDASSSRSSKSLPRMSTPSKSTASFIAPLILTTSKASPDTSNQDPNAIESLDSCPHVNCVVSCPWSTCSAKPTKMDVDLCQMIDPCWYDSKESPKPTPPYQGGTCACLCESGYCDRGRHLKPGTKNGLIDCAEWDCCHECGCYGMSEEVMRESNKYC